jgi:hypothetical protein
MPVTESVCWTGSRKQGRVDPQDVAVVRDCGEKAIETYREKAVKVRRRSQLLISDPGYGCCSFKILTAVGLPSERHVHNSVRGGMFKCYAGG